MRRVLDAHPRIHCGPEVKLLLEFHRCFADEDRAAHLRFIESARSILPDDELLQVLGAGFVEIHERAARNAGKPRWADKAPENAIFLDDWGRILGDRWVFVHVVRNPLDTLASMKENPFPLSVPGELDGRIDHYLRYVEAGVEFARLHPRRCFRVIYEDLVSRPDAAIAALMAWLGEDYDPAQLAFNSVTHQSGLEDPKIGASRGVHSQSVERWRGIVDLEQAERIVERAGPAWAAIESEGSGAGGGPDG